MRSRIILRERWGREPTEDEVNDEAAAIKAHLGSFSKKERPKPTEDEILQIIRAYSSGKQVRRTYPLGMSPEAEALR